MVVRAVGISAVALLGTGMLVVHGPTLLSVSYENSESQKITESNTQTSTATPQDAVEDTRQKVAHQALPEAVKALYMSACVAGTPSFRTDLVSLIEQTELNSVVIDIKDYSGNISFPPQGETWRPAWLASKCGTKDMSEFISSMHEKDIFVIGRITVFQDPFLATRRPDLAVLKGDGSVWKDHKGLSFIDVAADEYWDDIIELSVEAYNIGFDELNYDYVRYPSDGNMRDIVFPHTQKGQWPHSKPDNLEAFFSYLHQAMQDEARFSQMKHTATGREKNIPYISADLFGMTTSNYDDLSVGQVQERAVPYFDFIAPMVYPSHYPNGWNNYSNPNHYPYEVIHTAMSDGVRRLQATTTPVAGFTHERIGTTTPAVYQKATSTADKFRTWIQDFDYGGDYGPAEVRAQIKASYDAGVESWMLWAPSNRYTKEALLLE